MHLAQLNIARPRFPLDDPRMAGFVDNLDRVNAVAERSPGFVWRLAGEGNDATDLRFDEDLDAIVNLSVWRSAEDLEHFVWNTIHKQIYRRKGEWFAGLGAPHLVMWMVEEGHMPDLAEAWSRLDHLRRHGSSAHAFGWEGLPQLKTWMAQRCA